MKSPMKIIEKGQVQWVNDTSPASVGSYSPRCDLEEVSRLGLSCHIPSK